ncbi:MAG TPA: hypothetical protein VLW45_02420 [Pelomicrobium sp.]|nr:hypothetical protein [Pelomicrobium sp.]
MAERNLLREAAEASYSAVRRPAVARAVADPAATYGGALSVGLAPVVACLAQAVLELLAHNGAGMRPAPRGSLAEAIEPE